MKIALTIWGNRISPVFDASKTLLIVDIKNSKITNRFFHQFDSRNMNGTITILRNHKIDVLICGAISNTHSLFIEQNEIKLISFISGNTDKVLLAIIGKGNRIFDFLMPGAISDEASNKIGL